MKLSSELARFAHDRRPRAVSPSEALAKGEGMRAPRERFRQLGVHGLLLISTPKSPIIYKSAMTTALNADWNRRLGLGGGTPLLHHHGEEIGSTGVIKDLRALGIYSPGGNANG